MVFKFGSFFTKYIGSVIENHSNIVKIRSLRYELLKYHTISYDEDRSSSISMLIYLALKQIVTGLIMLVFGLMIESTIPIFGNIGYLGALYFLFNASLIFKPLDSIDDADQKIQDLSKELEELESKTQQTL